MTSSQQHHDAPAHPFPATQWSLVSRAGHHDADLRRQALSVLLHRYLPALRMYLLVGRRLRRDDAEDLLQGFVADKIIEQNLLAGAEAERGKFRTFLLATLNRYAISRHRADTAAKRSPPAGLHELNETAERVADDAATDPSQQFAFAWARETITEALKRMRAECDRSRRPDLWRVFEARVVLPAMDGAHPVPYQQLVTEMGLETPLQTCSLLTTAKRMFERNLRAVAAEYSGDDEAAVDREIDELRVILSRGGIVGAELPQSPRK